jgi:hypothetical protein
MAVVASDARGDEQRAAGALSDIVTAAFFYSRSQEWFDCVSKLGK